MKFFQANMQTGILVLLVVLVAIVCVALFFTNKEVRNIKAGVVKSRHDITAIQTLLNDVGLTASGGHLEDNEGLIDQKGGPPQSRFMGMPGMPGMLGMPPNVAMFPPGMVPPELRPDANLENNGEHSTLSSSSATSTSSPKNDTPDHLPADTQAAPATLNLEKPADQKEPDVIPPEDVEVVDPENKSQKPQAKPPVKPQKKPAQQEEEESSEDESESDDDSGTDDE
jgi:hypothetical protein